MHFKNWKLPVILVALPFTGGSLVAFEHAQINENVTISTRAVIKMATAAKESARESDNESNYLSESSESIDFDFLLNDDDVEPIANEQEEADYREELAREQEEEQMLTRRYSGEEAIETWYVENLFRSHRAELNFLKKLKCSSDNILQFPCFKFY